MSGDGGVKSENAIELKLPTAEIKEVDRRGLRPVYIWLDEKREELVAANGFRIQNNPPTLTDELGDNIFEEVRIQKRNTSKSVEWNICRSGKILKKQISRTTSIGGSVSRSKKRSVGGTELLVGGAGIHARYKSEEQQREIYLENAQNYWDYTKPYRDYLVEDHDGMGGIPAANELEVIIGYDISARLCRKINPG